MNYDDPQWRMPDEAFAWLRSSIAPGSNIVEFGSGSGTRDLVKHWNVWSVEHDERFINRVPGAQYIYAPIADGWYSPRCLGHLPEDYAAIIVDGPPGRIGRLGILDYLTALRTDIPWLIDDVHRRDECELAAVVGMKLKVPVQFHACKQGRAFSVVLGRPRCR